MLNLALSLALLVAASSGDTPLTLSTIEHRLAEMGPTATVRELDGAGRWEQVMIRIEAGDARWIALAQKLAQGADASTSNALTAALAEALPKSPRAVLKALKLEGPAPISPERVCTAPFQDGVAFDVPAYKAATLKALAGLSDARLSPVRDACVLRLQSL